jgi:hypothetical protein
VFGLGGDVNCDADFDARDLLTGLQLVAGLDVRPCLDVTLSDFGRVSEELGHDGGTLTTTALDGTAFTLEIPEGALAAAELITMTPVDSIDNLPPNGELVAAVELQPSGLEFWEPAILTIEPPQGISAEDQTPFVISGGEFVLHPLLLDSAEIKLPLTHFSAAGVAEGPPADVPSLSSAFDRYTAQAAALVLPQRAALLDGGAGDPDFGSELADLMEDYYDANLAPGLEVSEARPAGLGACPAEITIVRHAWSFVAQGQTIGGQQQFPRLQSALQALSPFFAGCRQADFDRCVQFHDLGAIGRIIAYTRVMEILGIPDSPSPLDEMIEKCARFEVTFLAWFCTDDQDDICEEGISYRFLTRQHAVFSMSLTPSTGPLASVSLELGAGDWNEHAGCLGYMESPGSNFRILSGGVSLNLLRTRGSNSSPPITLLINPGNPPETLYLTCDFGGGVDIQYTRLWWQKWCSFHKRDMIIGAGSPNPDEICFVEDVAPEGWPFAITRNGWYQSGDDQWVLDYVLYNGQVGVYEMGWEATRITIWHVPLP